MFFGMPSKIYNKSKETIHGTIGFISAILRMIKLVEASRVIVVFDEDCNQERIDLSSDYKANRTIDYFALKDDENPYNEEGKIIKCLESMKIKVLKSKCMEADDLIASLTFLFKNDNKVYISSYDSDFFQLIDDNVSIIRYKGKNSKIVDKNIFKQQFMFEPEKYVFYKSLVGDNADNIKGISGIGKKRATSIVNCCEDFNQLLNIANDLLPKKVVDNLCEEKDKFLLNTSLITLTYRGEIIYDLNDFIFDVNMISLTNSQILSLNKIFD